MRLPWISREAHEAVIAEKDARIAEYQKAVERAEGWATDWRAKYEAAIAPKPEQKQEPFVPTPREPSVIAMAIRQVAQGDTRLAAYLHARKRELKAEHPRMSDEGIAELLMTFETTEDVPEDHS